MRSARLLVVGLFSCVLITAGLVAAAAPSGAVAAKHKATETHSYGVEVLGQTYSTQSNGVAYYYCAVGVFAPFNDAQGYDAVKADLVVGGTATSVPIGDPPYDDNATTGGLVFKPYIGQHHVQVGTWREISGDATVLQRCEQLRVETDAATSDTVTVTFQAVGSCGKAIAKETKAADAVKKAKQKVKNASGPALAAAQKALDRAKVKLAKATKKVGRVCATVSRKTSGTPPAGTTPAGARRPASRAGRRG